MLRTTLRNMFAVAGAAWLLYRVWHEFRVRPSIVPAQTTDAGIRSLVKQTARWSLAAGQDVNPVVAMLHANYGVGYWSALRSLATMETIGRVAKLDPVAFEKRIMNAQAEATRRLIQQCPRVAPKDMTLARIAHGTL